VGGHIFDQAVDGSVCRWARILAFEPPDRVVFSWDISPQWQIESDPALTSEVEVRFVAEGPDRARVELEHRHLDRHGPGWESVRDGATSVLTHVDPARIWVCGGSTARSGRPLMSRWNQSPSPVPG